MAQGHSRSDLQAVAQAKLDDAHILLSHSRFSNAYYLAGYAVELGLKACIARSIFAEIIPDKRFIDAVNTHDLQQLVSAAGLAAERKLKEDSNNDFAANWAIAAQWRPEARYRSVDSYSAQVLIQAIADMKSGVFPWIKGYW